MPGGLREPILAAGVSPSHEGKGTPPENDGWI
jgi:hypothetical protein